MCFVMAVCIEEIPNTEIILNLADCSWTRVKHPREMSDYDYLVTCDESTKEKIIKAMDTFNPYYYII